MKQTCTKQLGFESRLQLVKSLRKAMCNTVRPILNTVSKHIYTDRQFYQDLTRYTISAYTPARWNTVEQQFATVRVTNIDNLNNSDLRCGECL